MTIYIRRSDGVYSEFEGMTVNAIAEMLAGQGMTGEVIDETEYRAAIAAAQTPISQP